MMIKNDNPGENPPRGQAMLVGAGIVAALAASSCCILPLVLFGIGVSGAWIGNLTRLPPHQPYFIAATLACLGGGYWLVYTPSKVSCAQGGAGARPLPNKKGEFGLFLGTILFVVAFGFEFLATL